MTTTDDQRDRRHDRRARDQGPVARDEAHMPSDVSRHVAFFDQFAEAAGGVFSRAPFFAFCVVLVILWVPSYLWIRDVDEWQMVIHTATTIVTFLMVALLQNGERRSEAAIQGKLNALADALAELIETREQGSPGLDEVSRELRTAVGVEDAESS